MQQVFQNSIWMLNKVKFILKMEKQNKKLEIFFIWRGDIVETINYIVSY